MLAARLHMDFDEAPVVAMVLNNRRSVLAGLGGLGMTGCASMEAPSTAAARGPAAPPRFARRMIAPILMTPERLIRVTVCTRPFRAAGPRLDVERVGDALVVHNYGHGGSGWSLSWGSSAIAAGKAMALSGVAGGPPTIAVIGCGALGLTSALQLQRLGARVVIYAKDRTPFTRSMRATGTWTPDSRIADADKVASDFPPLWERMARESFATHQTYLGQTSDPIVFTDRYTLFNAAPAPVHGAGRREGPRPIRFVEYGGRIRDMVPRGVDLAPGATPFPVARARFGSGMQFNITQLAYRLTSDFLLQGGRIETRVFNSPGEVADLAEKVVINCTGYGARALWNDQTIVPIRGQIGWLSPQREVDYGVFYRGVTVLSRPDGIVVQNYGDEMDGYGLEDETPDRAEAEAAISLVAPLFPPIRPPRTG